MSLTHRFRAALNAFLAAREETVVTPDPPRHHPSPLPEQGLLTGRNALITGAGRNIGRSIALELAAQGANIFFTDIDAARRTALADELRGYPVIGEGFDADIGDPAATDRLCDALVGRGTVIDLLVNNVGNRLDGDDLSLDPALWARTQAVNLIGPMHLTARITAAMRAAGRPGGVLFITSIHARQISLHPAYSASKAALAMAISELAAGLAGAGIRVNGIAPGWAAEDPQGRPLPHAFTPLHRSSIPPAYIGRAAVYLASEHYSRYTTGTVLTVDAGLSLHTYRLCQHPGAPPPESRSMTASDTIPEHWRRLLDDGRNFCLAPWLHLHLPAFGPASPCCMAQGDFGGRPADDIEGLRHSAEMNRLRAGMLHDREDPRCRNCTRAESLGFSSERKRFNREFQHHWPRLAHTGEDGSITSADAMVSWDLRFSNLCNFRCRMCFHGSSSKWHKDALALGWTQARKAVQHSVPDSRRFLDGLAGGIPIVEFVHFAGGEPLLMREHWQILDHLLAAGRRDTRLKYNTNLSRLVVHGRDVLTLWNQFASVVVHASIDGAGARGELIRSGFRWDEFCANARRIRREAPHVQLATDVTVSALNVLHLPELHRRLVEEAVLPVAAFRMHPLYVPAHYAVAVLPDPLRREAGRRIAGHRRWIDAQVSSGHLAANAAAGLHVQFAAVEGMLDTQWDAPGARAFRANSALLDHLRGEDSKKVFPELAALHRPNLVQRLHELLRSAGR